MNTKNVRVEPFCDMSEMWSKVLRDSRRTVAKEDIGKEPADRFKKAILTSKHSPIRKLKFEVFIDKIPAFVTQQFSRHHIAIESCPDMMFSEEIKSTDMEHFVQTSRQDRTGVKRNERKQTDEVSYNFEVNAQGLLDASKKRLCYAADPQAVKFWLQVKKGVNEICPELAERMQPECVCVGFCPEDESLVKCKYAKSNSFQEVREEYINK